jgi:hypothetical protein
LRKPKILVATLAMTLLFAAPAFAQDGGISISAGLLDTDVEAPGTTGTAISIATPKTKDTGGDAGDDLTVLRARARPGH